MSATVATPAPPSNASPVKPVGATKSRNASRLGLGVAGIVIFLGLWELAPRVGLVKEAYLPPVSDVFLTMAEMFGESSFWTAFTDTIFGWAIGLAIAVVLGGGLGVVIGMSTHLKKATNTTVEFLRPIPSVALIPAVTLMVGTETESTVILIVYACVWQVLLQVLYGVADVDVVATNTAQSFRFSHWQRIRDVVFPTVLPFLLTGVRIAAAIALILAITAGLVISTPGLGREIALAQSGGNVAKVYALVLTTGLIGIVINLVMRALERRFLQWHPSVRGDVAA